ncbi:MAG: hypothetical protein AWT59_2227, partial [Candidatus Gallionella acididurans]
MSVSDKVQEPKVSEFKCEHCGERIPKNEGFVTGRMVIASGVGRVTFYHKNREECLEA